MLTTWNVSAKTFLRSAHTDDNDDSRTLMTMDGVYFVVSPFRLTGRTYQAFRRTFAFMSFPYFFGVVASADKSLPSFP